MYAFCMLGDGFKICKWLMMSIKFFAAHIEFFQLNFSTFDENLSCH
jgi:hypothetical protein